MALKTGSSAAAETAATEPDLVVVATSDVHGNFFPYNFIERRPWGGSMARVAAYVDSLRHELGSDRVVVLDNGDILQGQPTAYYYNFIDTASTNIAADIYKYIGVDAATIGNHDVETGHDVYDRWIGQCEPSTPILGANVVDAATGEPYLKPYTILERNGLRIAVIGLLTPAIPAWLPENLWEGLRFDDLAQSAAYWAERVRRDEKPDLVIGLFHSGADSERAPAGYVENASIDAAKAGGYDLIVFGHDHHRYAGREQGADGREVALLNPANNARAVAVAEIRRDPATGTLDVEGQIVDIDSVAPSPAYIDHFAEQMRAVKDFVGDTIGYSDGTFASRDAFFGPSAFIDLIHRLQLEISGADISMAAPLSFDGTIKPGPLTIADMFTLYKYENMLYVMELTGAEIKGYLEKSYAGWTNQMTSPDDHLLLLDPSADDDGRPGLAHPYFNFDSAAGIDYTVDLTAPAGERVNITAMSDGRPFDPEATYRVAVNSYRGNGGGDLLTLGAGIAPADLAARVVWATDRDMRYYLMKAIEKQGRIAPEIIGNWRFIPDDYARGGRETDMKLLFPKN